jgi:transposase
MAKRDYIREAFFKKGKSKSEIARETGVDRKTVRKYIEQEDWNVKFSEKRKTKGKLDFWKPIIDGWLEEDVKHRKKQRHTAKRVYTRLVEGYGEDGFDCSYRTVASYVALKRKELGEKTGGYLPLEHEPGEAQYDFGSAEFVEDGKRYKGMYLNVSFPYSNAGFLQLFKGEPFECFAQGSRDIFEYIGGVPPVGWFDNASILVRRILKGGNRNLTDNFLRFKNHYNFEAFFCNPARGHEKGNVESKVGYHRRNMLVPIPEFKSIEEYNRELLKRCEEDMNRAHYRKGKSISKLFEEDKKHLLELPNTPFEAISFRTVKANGYGKVIINGGYTYSSRPEMAGKNILIGLKAHTVEIYDDNMHVVVTHPRLYGAKPQESMKWLPYLKQLSKRPAALKYTGIYTMLPRFLQEWLEGKERSEKRKVLKLLVELTERGDFKTALRAFEQGFAIGVKDLDSVKTLHTRLIAPFYDVERISLASTVVKVKELNPDVGVYDSFLKVGKQR